MKSSVAVGRGRWHPIGPVPRAPLLMSDCDNPDRFLELHVVDRIGEAVKQPFPSAPLVDSHSRVGHVLDLLEDAFKLQLKLETQPLALAVVIGDSRLNLRLSSGVNSKRFHEDFSRNSARKSSTGRPLARPPWISSTRRATSSSQAASTPSSPSASSEVRRKCASSARSLCESVLS